MAILYVVVEVLLVIATTLLIGAIILNIFMLIKGLIIFDELKYDIGGGSYIILIFIGVILCVLVFTFYIVLLVLL